MNPRGSSDLRCPVCGEGVLGDIAYDAQHPNPPQPQQAPESRELLTFSCGHQVEERSLAEAARNDPNVERRTAEETVAPVGTEGGEP
jgi:hypothetical protein